MKKLFKSLVSLTAAGTMLLSTTTFAAVSTVTTYTPTSAHVVSTVSGFDSGDMVTYLAVKGTDATNVGTNGENIVYIGQDTADASGNAVFSYDLTDVPATVGTYATIKTGSNNADATNGSDVVAVDEIVVNYVYVEHGSNKIIETESVYAGAGQTVNVSLAKLSTDLAGYEAMYVTVGSDEYEYQGAITATAGSTVNVYLKDTNNPVVYQLDGVVFDDNMAWTDEATGTTYSEKTGFVRVVGAVDKCWFTFSNGTADYSIGDEIKFPVSNLNANAGGYYAVQIVDDASLDDYVPTAHATTFDSQTVDVVKVTVQ